MPKFTVTLTETLTHRVTVDAPDAAQAMHAAQSFLTGNDHDDHYLLSASGFEATSAEIAVPATKPDLIAEGGK